MAHTRSEGGFALSGGKLKRLLVIVALFTMASHPVWAEQSAPSAAELLQKGLEQYRQGDYDAARGVLRKVDPVGLANSEQRLLYYQTLQDLDRRTRTSGDPKELLAQADQARRSGQLPRAVTLYEAVVNNTASDQATRNLAQARLAETRRSLFPDEAAARAAISEAQADLEADRLDAAEKKLQAVQASGIDLGWFEQERIKQQLQLISERKATRQVLASATPGSADMASAEAAAIASSQAGEAAVEDVVVEPPVAPPAASAEVAVEGEPQPTPAPTLEPVPLASETAVSPAAPAAEGTAPAAAAPAAASSDLLGKMRKVYAQQKVAEAREAEKQSQYRLAAEAYAKALELDPGNQEARQGQTAVQSKLSEQFVPTNLLDEQRLNRTLGENMTVAEFQQLLNQADQSLQARNFTAAQELVAQAKVMLDRNQRFLPVSQYSQLREQAVLLGSKIADQEQASRAQQEQQIIQQRAEDSDKRRREAIDQTDREVQRLLMRAAELRRELKYDEALQVVDQALFLDPNNAATQAVKMMIEDSRIAVQYGKAIRDRGLALAQMRVDSVVDSIPDSQLVTYPSDWPAITARRLGALAGDSMDSEVNRKVAAKLREPIPMNFEGARLDEVLSYIRSTTGVSLYINWAALSEAGIEPGMPVTVQLDNVTVERALQLVLDQASVLNPLDPVIYTIVDGYIHISTQSNLTRVTEIRVYDIRDLLVQVPHFTDAPNFDLASVLESGEGGGGASFEEGDEEELPTREEQVTEITTLLQDTVGRQDEWALYGGDQSSVQELNGNLIVKTTPKNHREIMDLLGQIRESRAVQIHVEGRFLLVDHNFLEEVGVDMDVAYDLPGPWTGIEVEQDSANIASRSTVGPTGVGGSFTSQDLTLGRSMDVSFGYLDQLNLSVLLNATQASRQAVSLTAPRLTFFNGQRAYVLVATQTSFISDLEPVEDTGGFDVTLDVINTGVVMDVEGTVSADRRYVTLTLRPSLATLKRFRTLSITNTVVNDNGDVVSSNSFPLDQPELEVTQVKTTVSVPDRGTLLLGGQRLVADVQVQAGVPILSKIPVLNRLFTNTVDVKDERTLLILITPSIIIQNEMEEELYPGLLSNPQQYNTGKTF
ncbi:MAG: hypothetical protein IT443_04320 [Phycisphaeraceae bacterium]|nr:hypothetical protein [Phycisphaeraceae bacterium]